MKLIRLLGNVLSVALVVVAGVLLLGVTALPTVLGYKTYVVLTGSMEPAIRTGSVVLAMPVPPTSLKVGDVIVYNRSDASERITHRVFRIKQAGPHPIFITKGDANSAPDTWTVQYSGNTAGKVVLAVPFVGRIYGLLGSPEGRLLFLVVPVVVLSLMWLWQIWRPEIDLRRREVELPGLEPAADLTPAKLHPASGPPSETSPPDSGRTVSLRQ